MRRLPKTHKKLSMRKEDEPDFYAMDKTQPLPKLNEAPLPGSCMMPPMRLIQGLSGGSMSGQMGDMSITASAGTYKDSFHVRDSFIGFGQPLQRRGFASAISGMKGTDGFGGIRGMGFIDSMGGINGMQSINAKGTNVMGINGMGINGMVMNGMVLMNGMVVMNGLGGMNGVSGMNHMNSMNAMNSIRESRLPSQDKGDLGGNFQRPRQIQQIQKLDSRRGGPKKPGLGDDTSR